MNKIILNCESIWELIDYKNKLNSAWIDDTNICIYPNFYLMNECNKIEYKDWWWIAINVIKQIIWLPILF